MIERAFGKGSVISLGEGPLAEVEAIPTGALSLDLALGVGGVPQGPDRRGLRAGVLGKTTLAYHVIAEAQRRGGRCAFIDAEHAMDPAYARRSGSTSTRCCSPSPTTASRRWRSPTCWSAPGEVALVVVDSVAALVPKAELEGQMGDQTVGLQARMMSQAMRKLAGNLRRRPARPACSPTSCARRSASSTARKRPSPVGGR